MSTTGSFFPSLPHAWLSMLMIKCAYVCVHVYSHAIRFYMQMPCEYWCFPVDKLALLISTVLVVFSAVSLLFEIAALPLLPRFEGLVAQRWRPSAFSCRSFLIFLKVDTESLTGRAGLSTGGPTASLHENFPRVAASTLSVFQQRDTVVKNLIFPIYCFVSAPWCTQSSDSNGSLFFQIFRFSVPVNTGTTFLIDFTSPAFLFVLTPSS